MSRPATPAARPPPELKAPGARPVPRPTKRRRDWGGIVARALCGVFALLGAVPLGLGVLVRLGPIERWAARETARLVSEAVLVEASYQLRVVPWPLEIAIEDLEVEANDGLGPAFTAARVLIRPRLFALLDGHIDAGEVEIDDAVVRVLIADGRVRNVDYQLPARDATDTRERIPFSELVVNGAALDVTFGGLRLRGRDVDLDVAVTRGATVQEPSQIGVSMRTGEVLVDRLHADISSPGYQRADEDRLCSIELRARYRVGELLIRRLALTGSADFDPRLDTRPSCQLAAGDWRRVALELETTRIALEEDGPRSIDGRIAATLPVGLVHRFIDAPPTTGTLEIGLESFSFADGDKLPRLHGRVRGTSLGIEGKTVAHTFDGRLVLDGQTVTASKLKVGWGGGTATIDELKVEPFAAGVPLSVRGVLIEDARLEDILDELGGHPSAWVTWTLAHTSIAQFGGTLVPLELGGPLVAETRDFGVFDRPANLIDRERRLGVEKAAVSGQFRVQPEGVLLDGFTITTPGSLVRTTVSLGFLQDLGIAIAPGSHIELGELSPIAGSKMKGLATVSLSANGKFTRPHITGTLGIEGFEFEGFPIGNVAEAKVDFVPLVLKLTDARVEHGASSIRLPRLSLEFGRADAVLAIAGTLDTRASGLRFRDLLDTLKLGGEPRFHGLAARVAGLFDIDFVLRSARPPCLDGRLAVTGNGSLSEIETYGERFDSGTLDFDYIWDDLPAASHGLVVDVRSATLRKGTGSALMRATIRHGGVLEGDVVLGGLPLAQLDMLGFRGDGKTFLIAPEGTLSATGRVGGTLERMTGSFDVDVSTVRVGPDALPPSRFHVDMLPRTTPVAHAPALLCGRRIIVPDGEKSGPNGVFRLAGTAFGKQLRFDDFEITREANPVARGTLALERLELAPLGNLVPGVAFSEDAVRGHVSSTVTVHELLLGAPAAAKVTIQLASLELSQRGRTMTIGAIDDALELSDTTLTLPTIPARLSLPSGVAATVEVTGSVDGLASEPSLQLIVALPPLDLGKLAAKLPLVQRASGIVQGSIAVRGSARAPTLTGSATLTKGSLRLEGVPVPLDDIDVAVTVQDGTLTVTRALATSGGSGNLRLSGRVPLDGLGFARATATLSVRDVKLPLADGIKATASADLVLSLAPKDDSSTRALPHVAGTVTLTQFTYARPMAFRVDLGQLTRAAATEVASYDPDAENLSFDLNVTSPRPLRIENDLIDARLEIESPGLRVSGTDQRFGAKGALRIDPSSKLYLQGHAFRVRAGTVRFDDLTRVQPRLDIVADTEYRRQAASQSAEGASAGEGATTGASATTATSDAASWRITMHATGDTDAPALALSSDPPLSQEDLVLLLQVGMTRAELDRGLASSLAQSVSLEALSAVTGLGQAVKKTVPLIDEFRLGSQYSSVSGRPEPTVTVGKRITSDVRATVTSGLSDSREVRTNIDWKLGRRLSVQGSYDNINDAASSTLGNLGVDLRWRLEFE
ncbi:MAG: hypothetical protein EXR75_02515 [Myxococcales bacterium]|nr:hypothetical protein [Myxococcales bacterium]